MSDQRSGGGVRTEGLTDIVTVRQVDCWKGLLGSRSSSWNPTAIRATVVQVRVLIAQHFAKFGAPEREEEEREARRLETAPISLLLNLR
jgi:hypothetical protein